MVAEPSIFDRQVEVPEELQRRAREQGWPAELLRRALAARIRTGDLQWWLDHDTPANRVERMVSDNEQITVGALRLREATFRDDEALADLFANSPEEIGEWEVTVERGPNPFAQFRLLENPQIQVLEERGVLMSVLARGVHNAYVGGRPLTVRCSLAARVRREGRGKGYSNFVRMSAPACQWYHCADYFFVRSQNVGALDWLRATHTLGVEPVAPQEDGVPGLRVSVYGFPRRPFDGDPAAAGIRPVRRGDLRRCVALINRTQRGLDLRRPYSEEFLRRRLDDAGWGRKPDWWQRVYGWEDYHVLEEDGHIVACAGLWDRGKDIREVWRNMRTGEQRVYAATALMDFGYAEGHEDAMVRLIAYLLGLTDQLGRDRLLAPIEQLPALCERLERFEPVLDTRALQWSEFSENDEPLPTRIVHPCIDLAYW